MPAPVCIRAMVVHRIPVTGSVRCSLGPYRQMRLKGFTYRRMAGI